MKVFNIDDVQKEDASAPIFTGGSVTMQRLLVAGDSEDFAVGLVNFSPGARTKLHIHESDQIVFATAGRGTYATEHEENEAVAGTMVLFPKGERHWHGATPDSSFSQISFLLPGETTVVE